MLSYKYVNTSQTDLNNILSNAKLNFIDFLCCLEWQFYILCVGIMTLCDDIFSKNLDLARVVYFSSNSHACNNVTYFKCTFKSQFAFS